MSRLLAWLDAKRKFGRAGALERFSHAELKLIAAGLWPKRGRPFCGTLPGTGDVARERREAFQAQALAAVDRMLEGTR